MHTKRVCIVGASGKLGRYMVRHALDRGCEVVGVCRERSVGKLRKFRTMDAMEKVRTIGAIGVGALVVAIQLPERLRAR